jgi:DNA-directed RNA polymerase subunit H (RpoH/RPB5)
MKKNPPQPFPRCIGMGKGRVIEIIRKSKN